MPPAAGIVGLILASAGSVCLAAQADLPAPPGDSPARMHGTPGDNPSLEGASRQLQAALETEAGSIKPVRFESPVPGGDGAGAGWPDQPPHQERTSSSRREPPPRTISPPGDDARLRLSPPTQSGQTGHNRTPRIGGLPSLVPVASSLGVVLGLFLVVAWAVRRTAPGGAVVLPSEVVEVLGRSALAGKAQVHLVRCGNKLLLVSLSPTGVETLTEITDPEEVSRLAGLCRQTLPGSTTAAFRQVLQQFAGQRTAPGPYDTTGDDFRLADAGGAARHARGREGRDV